MTSLNVPTIDPCIVLLHKGRNEQEFCRITLQCTTNTSTIYLNLLKARRRRRKPISSCKWYVNSNFLKKWKNAMRLAFLPLSTNVVASFMQYWIIDLQQQRAAAAAFTLLFGLWTKTTESKWPHFSWLTRTTRRWQKVSLRPEQTTEEAAK